MRMFETVAVVCCGAGSAAARQTNEVWRLPPISRDNVAEAPRQARRRPAEKPLLSGRGRKMKGPGCQKNCRVEITGESKSIVGEIEVRVKRKVCCLGLFD